MMVLLWLAEGPVLWFEVLLLLLTVLELSVRGRGAALVAAEEAVVAVVILGMGVRFTAGVCLAV